VDLCGANLWEAMEEVFGECRCTVLYRASKAAGAGKFAELLQYREVEGNLGDSAARKWHAAMARSGLYRYFAQSARSSASAREGNIELIEIRGKLFRSGVLMPHFTDLTTHADLNPGGLQLAHERDCLSGTDGIHALLLWHRWEREVDECRGIDIDVAVSSIYGEAACAGNLGGDPFGVGGVLLGNELVMITLNEDWSAPSSGDCAANRHHGNTLARADPRRDEGG
jgi:hypothetical protein